VSKGLAASAAVVLVAAGLTAGLALGSQNPRGQWATPQMVKRTIVGRPLEVLECPGGGCSVINKKLVGDWIDVKVRVASANVRGAGRSRIVRGQRRFQLFDVRACAIDYTQGGAMVGTRMHWYTTRPPSTKTTTYADGHVGRLYDGGYAYGTDWTYDTFAPMAHQGC
jgi:hypothetical protein